MFNATAAALISLQAYTQIPWFSFIVLCGVGVRLCLAPMMVRQMVLINKMSYAAPNFKLAFQLARKAKMPFPKRMWHGFRSCLNFAKQTNVNLISFYFYNLV